MPKPYRIALYAAGLTLAFAASGCARKTSVSTPTPAASPATVIAKDTVIDGDYRVEAGAPLILDGSAKLKVNGTFTLDGELRCQNGNAHIEADAVQINGSVTCEDTGVVGGGDRVGVAVVARQSVKFGAQASITTAGNIQIVSQPELLALTAEEVEKLYAEAATPSGEGNRIGPFTGETAAADNQPLTIIDETHRAQTPLPPRPLWGVPAAQATSHTVVIGGRVTVGTPPPGIRRIVVFNFPDAAGVKIENFTLTGPNGRDGDDDKNASCNARGKDGEDAFRLLVKAPNITINNFKLKLGNGGHGGDAETKTDCKPGVANGGRGGKPSNFKMIAGANFQITGAFDISTGNGGAGGSAIAHGKDGGPSEDGGDARSTGGAGGDNVKALSIAGTIGGVSNVTFDAAYGGDGGMATTDPGTGGDGQACGKRGGKGGDGTATGGTGGKASLTVSGGAGRTANAEDVGGNGGDADAHGAKGGNGGDCDARGPGGPGGKGGDATSKPGKGGVGKTRNGNDGEVKDETGGDGGIGGDGCKEGKGSKGGKGNPPGKDGSDGKNLCIAQPTPTPGTTLPTPTPTPVTNPQPTPTPTPAAKAKIKVQVIQYNGKYLPVDQLIIEDEIGCGADHWHAAEGVVRATDGTMVPDPGPQCGYGKVREKPAMQIEVTAEALVE